jgi:hypothetical protein
VHQNCYGSEIMSDLPKDAWYCQRCRYIQKEKCESDAIECFFCPEKKGIIKLLTPINTKKNFKISQFWAHVACVNWIKEVNFTDST